MKKLIEDQIKNCLCTFSFMKDNKTGQGLIVQSVIRRFRRSMDLIHTKPLGYVKL